MRICYQYKLKRYKIPYAQLHLDAIDFAAHQIDDVLAVLQNVLLQLVHRLNVLHLGQQLLQIQFLQVESRELAAVKVHFGLQMANIINANTF